MRTRQVKHLSVVRISNSIKHRQTWDLLITQWARLMDRYIDWEKELPYWNTERSLTGFLSAAAWSLGGVALEEYATSRKLRGRGRRRRTTSKGRCDLYIDVPGNLCCVLEVKQTWPQQASRHAADEVNHQLKVAARQLKAIPAAERRQCSMMAICFAVPEVLDGRAKADTLGELARLLADDPDLLAIYKVPRGRGSKMTDGRRTYPGVIMAGSVISGR